MRTGRFVAPSRGIGGPELVRVDAGRRQRLPWTRVCPLPEAQRLRLMRGPCHAGSWPTLLVRRSGVRRPAWLLPSLEHLDDDHASAAAGAWRAEVLRFVRITGIGRRGDIQEFACQREAGLAGGAGEQTVVPDAVEAAREDMEQEAADELVGRKYHHLLAIRLAFPPKVGPF
jgi:hypothetical protein